MLQLSCRKFGLIHNQFGSIEVWILGQILKSEIQFMCSNFGRILTNECAQNLNWTSILANSKVWENTRVYIFPEGHLSSNLIVFEIQNSKVGHFHRVLREFSAFEILIGLAEFKLEFKIMGFCNLNNLCVMT